LFKQLWAISKGEKDSMQKKNQKSRKIVLLSVAANHLSFLVSEPFVISRERTICHFEGAVATEKSSTRQGRFLAACGGSK
jgi:hypothetical protein